MTGEAWPALVPPVERSVRKRIEAGLGPAGDRILGILSEVSYWWSSSLKEVPRWPEVKAWPADERRRAALALHRTAGTLGRPSGIGVALRGLDSADLPWNRDDLAWCLDVAATGHQYHTGEHLELTAIIAARLDPAAVTEFVPALSALLAELVRDHFTAAGPRRRAVELIGRAVDRATGARLPSWLLHHGDDFGPAVRSHLSDLLAAPGVPELLAHCATVDKPVAPAKWVARLDECQSAASDGDKAVRAVLEAFATHGRRVHEDTDRLIRGLALAFSRNEDDEATDLLARVAIAAATAPRDAAGYPHAQRTAIASVQLLPGRPGEVPVRTLARLALTVKNRAVQSRIQAALAQLGALRGWSMSEVLELSVDDHGLDPDGRRVEQVGPYQATVEITGEKARLTFARAGAALKGVPKAVKDEYADELKQLRESVKSIGKTLADERLRVEGLLSEERVWAYQDWVSRLLDHPVSSAYGRRLLWETKVDGDRWVSGLPRREAGGWALVGLDGQVVRGGQVRLWHSIRAEVAEVIAWRERILADGVRQPFKQAFREVYLRTPAEEQTDRYSNRFAGHILRYRQANALIRVRGWQASYLGPWHGGHESEATKEFGGALWRASFFHALAPEQDHGAQVQYCSTDQVRFARRDGAVWEPTPLAEVPPPVFSEAMRDVDLFVGVTSIAADPTWADRGEDRFHAYWQGAAFGELTPSAEVRRDALARLLPRTKIADRVSLADRYLHVRGNLRSYRIHLGSGNIMMDPDDAYLCIVAARDRTGGLHLPFEDDVMLSAILSKAFLLAADDKITDESIVRQLARPPAANDSGA